MRREEAIEIICRKAVAGPGRIKMLEAVELLYRAGAFEDKEPYRHNGRLICPDEPCTCSYDPEFCMRH